MFLKNDVSPDRACPWECLHSSTGLLAGLTTARPASDPPVALIYLTDGYGSCQCTEPEYPVLWTTIGSEEFPFGQVAAVK